MRVSAGPITAARPDWGFDEESVTSIVSNDAGGHPDVLAAQIIVNAAVTGLQVTMLLAGTRDEDEVWKTMIQLLADGDQKSLAKVLSRLHLRVHACGTGRKGSIETDLVYAPGHSSRDLRDLMDRTNAPILVLGKELDGVSKTSRTGVIHVGGDAILVDSEGFEIPVTYDPSGPIYRPA